MAPDAAITDAAGRLAASAVEQGFPLRVTDPSVLGRIAAVIAQNNIGHGGSTTRARHRRKEVAGGLSTDPTSATA